MVYAVAFSVLMLHTDAHNKNVRQKMDKDTFIMRTKTIEGGENVPGEILDVSGMTTRHNKSSQRFCWSFLDYV
jgi:hypothetical protein